MGDNNCANMELHCLERARSDPSNRGKWIAQAERWHELNRAQTSWRFQENPFQRPLDAGAIATQAES
jgi:hypothetical protein